MAIFSSIPLSWFILSVVSLSSVIILAFICVCWQSKKKKYQAYILDTANFSRSEIANNNIPHVITENIHKFNLASVAYSAIHGYDELGNVSQNSETVTGPISYNILNIFKSIQRNKFNSTDDMAKHLTENLEDSNTEFMHKNFDRSVLCLNWNDGESPPATNTMKENEKDDSYSCISSDSNTFISAAPFHNRTYSVADTFKSANS